MPPRILSPQPKSLSLKHVRSLGSLRFSLNPPRRSFSASSFADVATKPSSRYQIYISQSDNPFLNLSIEHYLLQKTPIDSTVLFLYVNRPCVVIGRNQNPWLEANLQLLKRGVVGLQASEIKLGYQYPIDVDLIRRRSGGGTVFHDYGNVNYSVICPPPDFTRDKHAEMVVRAIRQIDPRARVNDRHDIVLDQGEFSQGNNRKDHDHLHGTEYVPTSSVSPALKVSGSAYKLTRNRSLHHGTCLIQSPNLEVIPQYLRSPAKAFMKARGVDSVRSPISNIYDAHRNQGDSLISSFQRNVLKAFIALYSLDHGLLDSLFQDSSGSNFNCDKDWVCGYIRESVKDLLEIEEGLKELESPEWIYGQTPQFVLSSSPVEEDDRPRPPLPSDVPEAARAYIKARSGVITSTQVSFSANSVIAKAEARLFDEVLTGLNIHLIKDFYEVLCQISYLDKLYALKGFSGWLNTMFGKDPC